MSISSQLLRQTLLITLLLAAPVFCLNPTADQWVPLPRFAGGINTQFDRSALPEGQLLAATNFIWRDGQLEGREGFQRFANPVSAHGVKFIDIFTSPLGASYLMYSDGFKLWYRADLTGDATELSVGRMTAGRIRKFGPIVRGQTIASQKWRTVFGDGVGDSLQITIGDTTYTVESIVLDTLLYLTGSTDTLADTTCSIDYSTVEINTALVASDNYWIYYTGGKAYFNNPSSFVVVDSFVGTRTATTSNQRIANTSGTYLKWIGSVSTNYASQFLRLVTDPISAGGDANPVTGGHAFYTSYPIWSSGSNIVSTYGGVFQTDSAGAEYYNIEQLEYDATTKSIVTLDSLIVEVQDSAGYSYGSNYGLYFRAYVNDMGFTDTMKYGTGDYFISPLTVETEVENLASRSVIATTSASNKIAASKITTPDAEAVRAFSISFVTTFASNSSITCKGAIYDSDTTLIDTTFTTVTGNIGFGQLNGIKMNFPEPVDLLGNTNYFVAFWVDSTYQYLNYNLCAGEGANDGAWSIWQSFDGSFPASITPTRRYNDTGFYNFVTVDYFDSTVGLARTATNCYPVIGGYVERAASDTAILVMIPQNNCGTRGDWGKAWNRMNDKDTTRVTIFRMPKNTARDFSGGYEFAVLHNERVFEVRSNEPDRFYYSEPFYPDSFLAGSVTIVDPAHPCIAAAKQWSDLVVWTTAGSWRVIADATAENYTVEKMNTSKGCLSRGSFINIDNVHYGLAADGFWQCDGNEPQIISGAVSKYFTDSLSIEDYDDIRTGYDAENDNIWISASQWTLVYHRATQSWWRQSFVAGAYAYNADVNVSDSVRFLAGERDSSTIFMRGGRTDDGTNVTASLQIPYLTLGDPVVAKRLKSLLMVYDSQVAAAVSVYGYRDYALTPFDTVSFTSEAAWSQKWLRFPDARYRGNNLSLGLSITNAALMKLPDMRIQIIPLGEED